ncbi:DUF6002 family protein [Actinoallomurus sp. NPDC052308]|uniref:DUF6002 family protein n=1 Tax=Actinoallomurus sp. NPDC052308 TaxID=3155530 RepID=UPI003413B66B
MRHADVEPSITVENPLVRYDEPIRAALQELSRKSRSGDRFEAGHVLPAPGDDLTRFFAASNIAITDLGEYAGRRLRLLDLMRNERTRTTKTFASRLIVARAVEHIRRTGERMMIVSPSSGNKATALRDAVSAAHETGLATPEELAILVVVPTASRAKLWSSPLASDARARVRNPVAVYHGARRDEVKTLAAGLVDGFGTEMYKRFGVRLWYTLDLDNYRVADIVRAFVEQDYLPHAKERLHVHAVSSAFGLLGHALGARRFAEDGHGESTARYFLVQHLDTPDMVLSLYFGSTNRRSMPTYTLDHANGFYRQDTDPRFPLTTFALDEILDSTFYTRQPATSAEMNALIRSQGGGGIVVSRHECLQRYSALREMLQPAGCILPTVPDDLREWSLVMALTGVLNGIDRGLVSETDILVHGSGSYQVTDFTPVPDAHLKTVESVEDLAKVAADAAEGKSV